MTTVVFLLVVHGVTVTFRPRVWHATDELRDERLRKERDRDDGFVRREQVNYDDGGYHHVFEPVDADEAADDMQRLLDDWYAKMGQLIREFRTTYDETPSTVPAEK